MKRNSVCIAEAGIPAQKTTHHFPQSCKGIDCDITASHARSHRATDYCYSILWYDLKLPVTYVRMAKK